MARPTPEQRGTLAAFIAVVINVAALVVANVYPVWVPWTHGVITPDWPLVLWAMNLNFVVQIAVNALLMAYHPAWLWRVADLLFALVGLLSVAVFYAVFPMDWSAIGYGWMNVLVRIALFLAMVALPIAAVVNLVRLVFSWTPLDHTGTSA